MLAHVLRHAPYSYSCKDKTFINERGRHGTKFVHQDTSSLAPVLPTTQFCVRAKGSAQAGFTAGTLLLRMWLVKELYVAGTTT